MRIYLTLGDKLFLVYWHILTKSAKRTKTNMYPVLGGTRFVFAFRYIIIFPCIYLSAYLSLICLSICMSGWLSALHPHWLVTRKSWPRHVKSRWSRVPTWWKHPLTHTCLPDTNIQKRRRRKKMKENNPANPRKMASLSCNLALFPAWNFALPLPCGYPSLSCPLCLLITMEKSNIQHPHLSTAYPMLTLGRLGAKTAICLPT